MAKTVINKKRARSGAMGYVILAVMILVIAFLINIQSLDTRSKLRNYSEQEELINEKIESEEARALEITEFEKYSQTKAYAEDQAHEKLGLVKEDEIIFKVEK